MLHDLFKKLGREMSQASNLQACTTTNFTKLRSYWLFFVSVLLMEARPCPDPPARASDEGKAGLKLYFTVALSWMLLQARQVMDFLDEKVAARRRAGRVPDDQTA